MKEKILYPVWGVLYVLCVCLGGISQRNIAGHIALMLLALAFFVPGVLILLQAVKREDKKAILRIRLISLASLSLTVILMIANMLSVWSSSQALGDVMYALLVVVSAPWACSYYGGISLFLWACLLMASFPRIWKIKQEK